MPTLRTIFESEGIRASALMVVGNVFAQGLSGIALIIFSRFVEPAEFGIFSTGFSIALLLAGTVDFGLAAAQQYAVARAESSSQRNQIFSTVLAIKIVFYMLSLLILWPTSGFLSQRLSIGSPALLLLIAAANLGSLFFNQLASMLQSLKRVGRTVIINIAQAVMKLGLVLAMVAAQWKSGSAALLIYLILPIYLLPLVGILLPNWYRFSVRFVQSRWAEMKSMALNNWIASFAITVIQNADIILVGILLDQQAAGLIGAASRIALLVSVIGSSLAAVLIPRVTQYRQELDLAAFWRKALVLLAGTGLLAAVSFVISQPLLYYTLGPAYLDAAGVLSWLLASAWLSVGVTGITSLFFSYDKPWFFSIAATLQALLLIAGDLWLVPVYGIAAAGWVRLISQLLVIVFATVYALQSHQKRYGSFPKLTSK